MKRQGILFSIAIIIFFVINSCDIAGLKGTEGPEGPQGPSGPAGPSLKGSLVGFITLYDEFGVLIADKSGVTVSVDGSVPALSSTTNSLGKYQIDSIKTGSYNLNFSKTGYATRKVLGYSFVGGEKPVIYNTTLSQKTTTLLTDLTLIVNPSNPNQMIINCTVSPATPTGYVRHVRLFFDKNTSVSSTNYLTTSFSPTATTIYNSTLTINKTYFPSGTVLSVIAYGESSLSYGYLDLTTGLMIYSTISSTPTNSVSSITVP